MATARIYPPTYGRRRGAVSEVLKLVLTNFWPFVAAALLIVAVGSAVAEVVAAWRRRDP